MTVLSTCAPRGALGTMIYSVCFVGLGALTLSACSSTTTGTGGTGDGGTNGAPSGAGRSTLSDGTLGSSCGTCTGDLSCATSADIPGGYCTKACAASSECGAGNYCIQTSAGPACLRGCQADTDCRESYSCQSAGQGASVCYPAASATSGNDGGAPSTGNTSGPTCGADLYGGWWGRDPCSATCEQYNFKEDGTFDYELYNSVSGTIPGSGTFTIACPNLSVTKDDNSSTSFVINGGVLYEKGQYKYAKCSGKCF